MATSSLSSRPPDTLAYAFSFFTDPGTSLGALFVPRADVKKNGATVITLDERVWGPLNGRTGAVSNTRASLKGKERARDGEEPLDRTSSSSDRHPSESLRRDDDRFVGPSSRGATPTHEYDERADSEAGLGRPPSRRAKRRIGWSDDEDDEAERRRIRSPRRDPRAREESRAGRSLSPGSRGRRRSRSPSRRRGWSPPPHPSLSPNLVTRPRGGQKERERRLRRERRSSPPPRADTPSPRWTHARSPTPPPFTSDRLACPLAHLDRDLPFDAFAPYLLPSTPVDQSWSMSFHFSILRFLTFCAPPFKWSTRPSSPTFKPPSFSIATMRLLETQPDLISIRRLFPLRRTQLPGFAPNELAKWSSVQAVLTWIYGPGSLTKGYREAAWFVQEAPLPLLVLVRRFADVDRYRAAISHAWRECTQYLLDPCRPFASIPLHERRAGTLVRWLNRGGMERQVAFFAQKQGDGEGRTIEEVWEWWFRGEEGKERGEKELDEWEKARLDRTRRRAREGEREGR
ncbi:hypothetical protein JCM10207_001472 [Rhodosporidiobolus poonsookiae]